MSYLKLGILLLAFAALTSACSVSLGSNSVGTANDGGVWLSGDKGATWRQVSSIPTISGRPGSLANTDINMLSIDAQDSSAVYLGTISKGLYYTYNVNNGWVAMDNLGQGTINDVKVDPKAKCTLFVAITNRLYRSLDCGRGWQQVYFDNNPGVNVTTIAIDHYNSENIYIGTSRGDIIKSIDRGLAWRTIQRVNDNIARIIISPQDSRLVFVATNKSNIYSFYSNSVTVPKDSANVDKNFAVDNWQDLSLVLKDFNLGSNFRDIVVSPSDASLFLATEKAIVRSPDQGLTWENIKLLTPEKDAIINAIAINPNNSQEIYYVTNTTFFSSPDGGVTWITKKLSTSRAGWELLVDFNNPKNIYLGTKKLQ
ncbi:MAG: hypothetical protein PHE20_00935 [Patescibacteria group bacterium]|nr:hypothetical protein [Patescibacteria group bacterium]